MAEWSVECVAANDETALEAVRSLFAEYHEWLGDVVCSHRLAEEIASLPGPYAEPQGRLLLASAGESGAAGCAGVRPHAGEDCEIKRLYVRVDHRGTGLGAALLAASIAAAREIGYRRALITTMPDAMPVARAMYERAGFRVTAPFADHSHVADTVRIDYLELDL